MCVCVCVQGWSGGVNGHAGTTQLLVYSSWVAPPLPHPPRAPHSHQSGDESLVGHQLPQQVLNQLPVISLRAQTSVFVFRACASYPYPCAC